MHTLSQLNQRTQELAQRAVRHLSERFSTLFTSKDQYQGVGQSKSLAQSLMMALCIGTGISVVFLIVGKTDQIVIAPGKIEPIGDSKSIQIPTGGVLKMILVKDGQYVKQGDVLLRMDSDVAKGTMQSINEAIEAKKRQLILKSIELDEFKRSVIIELQIKRQQLVHEKDVLSRLSSLAKEGGAPLIQFFEQRSKVATLTGEIDKLQVDASRQVASLGQDVQRMAAELSELQARKKETAVNLIYQEVRSPVDGYVFDLKPKSEGFVAQASETVMKVVPISKLEAKVEVPSADIGFVRTGMNADISIDSFPSTDFGVLEGKVSSISSDALTPDPLKPNYRFPVSISLTRQNLKLPSGQTLPLRVGMSVQANIKLRRVSIIQLLLGEFQNKAEALRRL